MGPAKSRNPQNPRNSPKFTKSSVYIKQIPLFCNKIHLHETKII